VKEGETELSVPDVSLRTPEPPTSPVFFNPAAELNRDVSVAVVRATKGSTFCDALAGVGARGVRVANEAGRELKVSMVDFNELSLSAAKRNAGINGVSSRCEFVGGEANAYLFTRFRRTEKFDYVDVDPFGTPVSHLQAALNATADGGLVSVTATDTAVLCGVYPGVSRRRYSASTAKGDYCHETGVRILANACRRVAGSLDLGAFPVLAHCTRHYVRVYLRVEVGASRADAALENEGYVAECPSCGERFATRERPTRCENCDGRLSVAGPLWVGPLVDEGLLKRATKASGERARLLLSSLRDLNHFPPYGYDVSSVSSALRLPGVSPAVVADELRLNGFRWGTQPFEKKGLKTDASYAEVADAVTRASSRNRSNTARR